MIFESEKWGTIEYTEDQIIKFQQGIPGFNSNNTYVILPIKESPFFCMQSTTDKHISFVLVNPFEFFKEYEFVINEQVKREMDIKDDTLISVYSIVKIIDDLEQATVNLAAPIVIQEQNRQGMQYIIPEGSYIVDQPLFLPIVNK